MNSLESHPVRELYNLLEQNRQTGVEGYHVDNKYVDPRRIKEDKDNFEKSTKRPKASPLKPVRHKSSYLDEVQKFAKQLPSPSQYNIEPEMKSASKTSIVKYGDRKTIFDEMQRKLKKDSYPSAATYQLNPEKDRHRSNLSKAESPDFLEASMRNSIETPGVGQYNGKDYRLKWRGHFVKWVAKKNPTKKDQKSMEKLPPVGTYTPVPAAYDVFDSIETKTKKKKPSVNGFGKQERFQSQNPKKLPKDTPYNLVNEWGIKDKLKKKGILQKISKPSPRSVYY